MSNLTVGAGQQYATVAAAVAASRNGDVLLVQAGTYVNDFAVINTSITIRGVGGMVHMQATVPPPNGKAILVTNADVTVDHLEFSGVWVPDLNGAGIRMQRGNLTVLNSHFHDNQMGILTAADATSTLTIRNSEFDHNRPAGDTPATGLTHNLYVNGIARLEITDSYFHDAAIGHEIKSRAAETIITGTRIADLGGTASYSVDLPNGGRAVLSGNVIEQGPASSNPTIVAFGAEGNLHAGSFLEMRGNTVLNDLPGGLLLWNATGAAATVADNALYGIAPSRIVSGPAAVSGTMTLTREPALDASHPWAGAAPILTPVPPPTSAAAPEPVPPSTPAATPDVVVPSTPAPTPAAAPAPAAGPDTLVLHLSEDAWRGDALFTATLDGQQLGGGAQAVTASHAAGATQDFTFTGSFGAGPHTVAVTFLNDAWGGTWTTDRNLYVDAVSYNGVRQAVGAALFRPETATVTVGNAAPVASAGGGGNAAPVANVGGGGNAAAAGNATPAAGTHAVVVHLSQDAWQGDAQFSIAVDGQQRGGVQTATASHAAGASQAVVVDGLAAGKHTVEVSFHNDAWGGTWDTDRNLYVDALGYNGQLHTEDEAALYGGGTVAFHVDLWA